jgi:hypothetical protein
MTYIKAGFGFDVGHDFFRAMADIPIKLAPAEYAKAGYVIGYIAGDLQSRLGSTRKPRVRVHVRHSGIIEA